MVASAQPYLPAGDDAVTEQAVAAYRVADHSVGPYREALAGGEECRCLTAGEQDADHGVFSGSGRRMLIAGDDRREVAAVMRLENAATSRRSSPAISIRRPDPENTP